MSLFKTGHPAPALTIIAIVTAVVTAIAIGIVVPLTVDIAPTVTPSTTIATGATEPYSFWKSSTAAVRDLNIGNHLVYFYAFILIVVNCALGHRIDCRLCTTCITYEIYLRVESKANHHTAGCET